ncbi:VWA domain-containing protein [Halobacterium wangiae]|uniref:VWA domain-containing protein n=1 Tax=Halobacterium wangiae TaxID=2902623 RepID=UPI001E30B01B|nr:VWA domain-containing protein [Halobacterium wangiae]
MTADCPRDSRSVRLFDDSVYGELVTFVRALRTAGAAVPANAAISAAEALSVAGVTDKERTRVSLRTAVITRADDRDLFDHLFEQFWGRLRDAVTRSQQDAGDDAADDDGFGFDAQETPADAETVDELPDESGGADSSDLSVGDSGGDPEDVYEMAQYSPVGASESVTPSSLSEEAATAAATERLTSVLATQTGRRPERANAGSRPDVRRALRNSVSTGGVLTSLPELHRKETEVRGVVFADVSRSMLDVLDRSFLVSFLRAVHQSWRSAQTFIFDTDVREITDALDTETADATFDALEAAEAAWGGGTRIGHAIESVHERDPDVVDHRTVVLVLSDGLEMGELDELESGMAWLARRASLVVWLNPLAKSSEYEPTAAGMATAVPYVDCLYPFAGVEDVDSLARELQLYPPRQVGVRPNTVY